MTFLVQVEWFFVAGLGTGDRKRVMTDLVSRVASGANIKRSIRFRDVEGRISERVILWGRRDRLRLHIFKRTTTVGKRRRRKLERLWDRFNAFNNECEMLVSAQILDHLRSCMVRREDIALEDFGGEGFRILMRNEIAELLLLLERAHERLWIFVFKDNDLLSDQNPTVGYIL